MPKKRKLFFGIQNFHIPVHKPDAYPGVCFQDIGVQQAAVSGGISCSKTLFSHSSIWLYMVILLFCFYPISSGRVCQAEPCTSHKCIRDVKPNVCIHSLGSLLAGIKHLSRPTSYIARKIMDSPSLRIFFLVIFNNIIYRAVQNTTKPVDCMQTTDLIVLHFRKSGA